jgi:hypothetical protein
MTSDNSLKKIQEFAEQLRADPVRLKAFMRKVMGPDTVELKGKEKDDIMLLLKMIEPFEESNNQRAWTDKYMIGETEYHVTYWEDETVVERILKDDEDV